MFKKFFKRHKNKAKGAHLETDSIAELPRQIHAVPIAIPNLESQVNWNVNRQQNTCQTNTPLVVPLPNSQPTVLNESQTAQSSTTSMPFQHSRSDPVPVIQLSVSHSHGFHIGEVHNITISNGSTAHFNSVPSSLLKLGKSLSNTPISEPQIPSSCDISSLVDLLTSDFSRVKDWQMSLISENIEDWKGFGNALEITPVTLNEIEQKTGGNVSRAVLELLKNYSLQYSDTSIGFIATALSQSGNSKAVKQLAKLRG